MTELHVSGDAVHISKRFHMDHQVVPPIAAGPFVFDLMNHAFGVIRGLEGWRLWEDLRSACYCGNEGMRLSFRDREDGFSFSLSVTDFQRIKLFIPAESEKLFLQSALFLIDGEKAKPEPPSTPSYLLGIIKMEPPGRGYLLEPQFNAKGMVKPLSGAVTYFFTALEGGRIRAPLKARKRKEILYQTFFQALAQKSKKAREEVIRDSIEAISFGNYRLMKEGRRILREYLEEKDEGGKHLYRIMERLVRFQRIEETSVPKGLKATLRAYQREGFDWLSFLYDNRFGACLADDMGLGKTLQAIMLLARIKEKGGGEGDPVRACHLIVVPPSLLFNWEREFEKFYPGLKIYLYQGRERTISFEGYDVVLTTYGLVNRDIDTLKEVRFDVIVFDEAQAVKNIHADRTGAVRQLKASFKLALTGTPVENHIGEYFSIMDLVLPGLLGDYDRFRRHTHKDHSSFLDTVIRRTKPFILRRTKEETLKELPPKIETDFHLDLTEKQKGLYSKTVEAVRSTIDEAFRMKTTSQAKIIALTGLLKLRQICLTPRLLIPEMEEGTPKIEFIKAQLTKLYAEGHHALVFSQFTSFLDIVEEGIQGNGLRIFRLDGSTPVGKRKKLVEEFQKSQEPSVFLLSLKAGGQGLNLTRATYVFHLDPWWNPAVENQASDRAHRIGQKKKVIITRLIMRHTIEEKMMELKKRKLKLYQAILESPSVGGRLQITKEDFDYLLSAT
jgi:SNF2 family DNA or RNA helicase